MEDDDMDSLFEGMVLFTPSQLANDDEQQNCKQQQQEDDDSTAAIVAPLEKPQSRSEEADDASRSASFVDNSVSASQQNVKVNVQAPLDENLFSDLTLVLDSHFQSSPVPSDPIPIPATTTPPSGTSRLQLPRKKKRAASLRIGYARDSSSLDNDNDSPLHTPTDPPYAYAAADSRSLIHDSSSSSSDVVVNNTASANPNASPSPTAPRSSIPNGDNDNTNPDFDSQLQRIKSQISEKLQHFRQLASSVSSDRKVSISRRRKATQHLNSAFARQRDLESQLEAACEAEDFEAAQRISDSLAAADEERQAFLIDLKDAEADCDSIHSKMQHVLDSQIAAEQECAALLSNFAKDAENNADLLLKKAQSLSSEEVNEWFSSVEALEAQKIELEIESHFIHEARLLVTDSIDHSVEDYKKEQEILHRKKDVLADELQKLLALVKLKEKEIAENDTHIKAIEEKIADVVSGFQESQSSIDAKHNHLQSQLSQMRLQNEALSTKRQEIDKFLADKQSQGAKLRELARVSEDEAKTYQEVVELRKSLMLPILKSMEDKERLVKTEEKLVEDVQTLQHEVSSARASLQELSSTKSIIQQTIASLKQRIFFIDKRVPELEAEKKVAAAARNFKEAARIAAEAKSLSIEKDGVLIELEKAITELEKLEEDIKNTISRLQDTEELISSKEKEVAMARFQSLLLIAGVATAERFAALELGDIEEAKVLLSEAEAANAEAKKIQPIYNFNEEEVSNLPKHFISMELVSKLGRKQLEELAASVDVSASQ